jgi:DNA-binding winged helix-turn-helix (wHTH) protein
MKALQPLRQVQRGKQYTNMPTDNPLLFPPFRLERANGQLWRDEALVPLRPKSFAVLRYLVEHPGRLVTRQELQNAIWPGIYVSEGLLRGYIRELREILEDDANAPRFIETVPRRGWRFLAPVTADAAPVPSPKFQVPSLDTQHSTLSFGGSRGRTRSASRLAGESR